MKRKFNFRKKFGGKKGKYYDQIAHEQSKRKAKEIRKYAKEKGYYTRLTYHPLKKDKHFDVYVRKKKK